MKKLQLKAQQIKPRISTHWNLCEKLNLRGSKQNFSDSNVRKDWLRDRDKIDWTRLYDYFSLYPALQTEKVKNLLEVLLTSNKNALLTPLTQQQYRSWFLFFTQPKPVKIKEI